MKNQVPFVSYTQAIKWRLHMRSRELGATVVEPTLHYLFI
jgi:hypothetical protein